jgi:hypothetical protein
MIIEYNGIKYKMEHDKSLNMTLLYNTSKDDINNVLNNLIINKIDSENTIINKFPDNVVGYWCKVLNTVVLL